MINTYYFEILLVTFWHENCLYSIKHQKTNLMKELIKQYEQAKKRALTFMQKGQLHAYFDALVEMNRYKKLMVTVQSN